ncbi:hypothetical protein GCM10027416_12450 [Okibacterium endophyticum]
MMQSVLDILDETLHEVQGLASDLRQSLAGRTLSDALQEYAVSLEASLPRVVLTETGVQLPLSQAMLDEAFMIIIEAVRNARRHSQTDKPVKIGLVWSREGLVVTVVDDGIGFGPPTPSQSQSLGILGMRERAELIGADLIIETEKGDGTTVTLQLPAHPTWA